MAPAATSIIFHEFATTRKHALGIFDLAHRPDKVKVVRGDTEKKLLPKTLKRPRRIHKITLRADERFTR
jgi:hypothetical protein